MADEDNSSELAEVLLKDLDSEQGPKPATYEPPALSQEKKESTDVVIDAKYLAA